MSKEDRERLQVHRLEKIVDALDELIRELEYYITDEPQSDEETPGHGPVEEGTSLHGAIDRAQKVYPGKRFPPEGQQLWDELRRVSRDCETDGEKENAEKLLAWTKDALAQLTDGVRPQTDMRGLKVSEAERVSNINRGQISRAADTGELKSNGKTGRERRIDTADFCRWVLARSDHPERAESSEHVERLMRRYEEADSSH